MAFKYKQQIVIDPRQCGTTNSTNFPMLVSGTYGYLKTIANGGFVTNASGYDIGFYSDFGLTNKLNWETETYTATSGLVNYWVQVPTLSNTVPTVIYMAYGDSTITTDQSNKTGTWDTNFKGVWHLPDGTTLTANDSTSNSNNGTLTNTPTAATGQIGGAGSFASASSQYITDASTTGISFADNAAHTISAWIKTSTSTAQVIFATFGFSVQAGVGFLLGQTVAGRLEGYLLNSAASAGRWANVPAGGTSVSDNAWHHVVFSYDGSSSEAGIALYVDSVSQSSLTNDVNTAPGTLTSTTINIARRIDAIQYFNGQIDELRVSCGTARSQSWITAEYNNQKSGSTFYTITAPTSLNNYEFIKVGDGMSVSEKIR